MNKHRIPVPRLHVDMHCSGLPVSLSDHRTLQSIAPKLGPETVWKIKMHRAELQAVHDDEKPFTDSPGNRRRPKCNDNPPKKNRSSESSTCPANRAPQSSGSGSESLADLIEISIRLPRFQTASGTSSSAASLFPSRRPRAPTLDTMCCRS